MIGGKEFSNGSCQTIQRSMPLRLLSVFVVAVAVLGVGQGCTEQRATSAKGADSSVAVPATPVFDVRAVTLDARNAPEPDLLPHLRDLGVTHVALVSFGWQNAVNDPIVRTDTSDGWYSESHRGIRALAQRARSLGMGVILKPHLWVGGYDESGDRSEIGFETDEEWRRWETHYEQFLLTYARLAAEVDADILVLGTELSRSTRERPTFWRNLADSVRTVYDGQLTYAANWHKEYQRIRFWDALDYVGVQAYFPLSKADQPSLDTLRSGGRRHRRALAEVHGRTGKPILLTEIGYRSAPNAAAVPWQWPEQDDVSADSPLQARCYRAILSTVGQAPWLAGAVVWKWHPPDEVDGCTGFTPQGKPAEHVLRRWFTRTASPPGSDS